MISDTEINSMRFVLNFKLQIFKFLKGTILVFSSIFNSNLDASEQEPLDLYYYNIKNFKTCNLLEFQQSLNENLSQTQKRLALQQCPEKQFSIGMI